MRWEYEDVRELKRLHREGVPFKVIAANLGREEKSVRCKVEKLGLRRNRARLSDDHRFRATFTLPAGLAAALDAECRRTGLTIGRIARMAITARFGGAS